MFNTLMWCFYKNSAMSVTDETGFQLHADGLGAHCFPTVPDPPFFITFEEIDIEMGKCIDRVASDTVKDS